MCSFMRSVTTLCLICFLIVPAIAFGRDVSVTPDEALQKLLDGNKQYSQSKHSKEYHSDSYHPTSTALSSKPYAIIVTCSDFPGPSELLFNKRSGEIIEIRVAGNVPDYNVIRLIGYLVERLNVSLIMVLGHEKCEAMSAIVKAKGRSTERADFDAISTILFQDPAAVAKKCAACKNEVNCADINNKAFMECYISDYTKSVPPYLMKRSARLKKLVTDNKLAIVAAEYQDNDTVKIIK